MTEIVDPTEPMEIIVSLSQQLQAWTDGETQLVVSLQTLTALLEYVDFDTIFRYLHVLTHRIRAAGATGYFQTDPDIHDLEIINTLKTLFDVVVEVSDGNIEWIPTSSGSLDTETTLTSETTDLSNMLTDDEQIRSLLIQYGGRMKQVDLTAETPWSKSTVSRKLKKMEAEGTITRVQVGRGNLVFLNGSEPDAAESPFET